MRPVYRDDVELAAEYKVTPRTVRYWARIGIIPSLKIGNKTYFNMGEVVPALRRAERRESSQYASAM